MDAPVTVTVLGSRGSIPVCGEEYSRYGGATCCVLIKGEGQAILLDAGTGILKLPRYLSEERTVSVFITHPHLDHIMGLPMCPAVFDPEYEFRIYGVSRGGVDIGKQIGTLIAPPLWPIRAEQLPARVLFRDLEPYAEFDRFSVRSMEGTHPGGVSVLRVTIAGRSIVLMTDCTITPENRPGLLEFCRDCDLLLCDGQYSDGEWNVRSGFGHNTWSAAARFGHDCGAKLVRILHHDPCRTDAELDQARLQVQAICPVCGISYCGEELIL